MSHLIYWDHYSSIHNWIEQLNLTCTPKLQVGLIGSSFFLGWAISCLIIPILADKHGRKKVFCISVILNLIIWFLTLFSKNLYLTLFLMLCFGFLSVGRLSVGYFLLLEYTPKRWQSLVGSVPHIFNNLVAIILCVYFGYISKYWIPLQAWTVGVSCIFALMNFLLPESPKFLITKKKFDEARVSIQFIAKINGYK